MDYPDFNKNIISYASVPGYETNEIENIGIIKSKLEYLLNRSDNPDLYNKQNNSGITISNINNNNNTNNVKPVVKNVAAKNNKNVPKTGDNANVLLWIALAVISCGVLAGAGVAVRKRK